MGYALPLDELSVDEKLDMIEQLWQSLAKNPESVPSPDWHADVLRERERQIADGTAVFHPFDEVFDRLEKLSE